MPQPPRYPKFSGQKQSLIWEKAVHTDFTVCVCTVKSVCLLLSITCMNTHYIHYILIFFIANYPFFFFNYTRFPFLNKICLNVRSFDVTEGTSGGFLLLLLSGKVGPWVLLYHLDHIVPLLIIKQLLSWSSASFIICIPLSFLPCHLNTIRMFLIRNTFFTSQGIEYLFSCPLPTWSN